MRLTIIKSDNMVYIDGKPLKIDCSSLPDNIHALQWDGNNGWIEYVGHREPNLEISDISDYQSFIDAWKAEDERLKSFVPSPIPETSPQDQPFKITEFTSISNT